MLFKYVWFKLLHLAYEFLPPTFTYLMLLALSCPTSCRFGNGQVTTFSLGVGLLFSGFFLILG